MSATHHLTDELLEDYVRGHLSVGWGIGVASHLALCPECRKRAETLDAIGGALIEDIEPVDVTDGEFEHLMNRIGDGGAEPSVTSTPKEASLGGAPPLIPEPLRGILGKDFDQLKWRRLSGDVSQVLVDTGDSETMCRLLRVKAGRPVAAHSHSGKELTLVLSGSFADSLGTFRRGDVEVTDETVEHQPVSGPDEDCICLAVTDAPLQFRNPIVRLLQPLFRI